MPKATIYKYRESRGSENKVGLAVNALIATPAGNAVGAEDFDQFKFGGLVAG